MNSRRLIAAPESRGGILSSKTERVEAAHNVRFGSKADMCSARAHVRYKRTSEGDRTHDRGHDQRYSTSRAIPTRSRHTQAAIDSPVIARRSRDSPVLLSGLGSQELRGVYRLIQITALIAVNADSKISIIKFNPKRQFFWRIDGWQFEQANLEGPNPRNRGVA
jgi:hypothetical protein